jgi:hypothetical protein
MKPYSDNFCVGMYIDDNKQHLAILQSPDDLLDTITGKRFLSSELETMYYTAPNKSLYKYLISQFRKHRDKKALTVINLYETGIGSQCVPLLRFFDLDYQELFAETNSKETINKVVAKCKKYLKRYVSPEVLLAYVEQASLFTRVLDVFCFLSVEIRKRVIPFWHTLSLELFGDRVIYPLCDGINTEILKRCNALEISLAENLTNLKEFNGVIEDAKEKLVQRIHTEYKELISKAAHQRLAEANATLSEELEYAKTADDQDLLTEVETIWASIKELETTIDQQIAALPVNMQVMEWWPDLLYPAPKVMFQYTEPYYYLLEIQDYFKLSEYE